jgi:hypothetical protein
MPGSAWTAGPARASWSGEMRPAATGRYVIPSEAAPYAGSSLGLSLFDVTKLAAAGTTPNTRIPDGGHVPATGSAVSMVFVAIRTPPGTASQHACRALE